MSRWTKAQELELEWWTNNNVDPRRAWRYYDLHFIGELQDTFECSIDIGSGPVSYLHNHNVRSKVRWAIDPLIMRYRKIAKFQKYGLCSVLSKESIPESMSPLPDAVFMLNMLDHVEDPIETMIKVRNLMAEAGKLFIFCDLDKKTDIMHPHRLSLRWFQHHVFPHFTSIVFWVAPSWKFSNSVLYYVGRKK
jgi:hypothetical protein